MYEEMRNMMNTVKIIRSDEYKTSRWSGGTTTELLIYPYEAKYAERNFKWRLSSAKVIDEESVFTHLPGIARIIMSIDGNLTLHHEGHYEKDLKPFEQDNFMGDWNTKSFGKVTDFNLMMALGCQGKIETYTFEGEKIYEERLNPSEYINREKDIKQITYAFYILGEKVETYISGMKVYLNNKDTLAVTTLVNGDPFNIKFCNKSEEDIKVVKTEIVY